jgi:cell wall-associated NlpC family hydrolase
MNVMTIYAESFLGKPYLWGGDDPINGMDCSGYIIECLKSVGLLPNKFDTTSQGLHDLLVASGGEKVLAAKEGDIVFFGTPKITHVALAISKDLMFEAGGGDSSVVDSKTAAAKNAFVRMRPINMRADLSAIVRPNYKGVI